MKKNPETLSLAMDYASVMEACAAYVAVTRPAILAAEDAYRILQPLFAASGGVQELFMVLLLDTKNRLIGPPREVFRGTLNSCITHPREVFSLALREGGVKSLLLAHNHPSGDPTPSSADLAVTRRLVKAGRILDIRVLDALVCGQRSETNRDGYVSMRERNLCDFS